MSKILIQNGHLIDPYNKIDAPKDVLIEDGVVVAVEEHIDAPDAELIDAKGKWVCPGFIDLHVHFRTPGQEHKETMLTGARAAVQGGYTTVCTMANTDPVVDTPSVVEFLKLQASQINLLNILPFGAVTKGLKGESLTEMGALRKAGVIGFSDDGMPVMDAGVMRRALEYSKMTGLPVSAHCEDKCLSAHGVVHEGSTSMCLGLPGAPETAETVMIARDLLLAEASGGYLHIAHVSTRRGVELVRAAKAKGLNVTAEVTPHHLVLTDEVLEAYDARYKMNPPLRVNDDVQALREGLADGTLDAIATDHAPHAQSEKEVGLLQAPFGVIGLETAFSVLFTKLVCDEQIDYTASQLVAALTHQPAKIIGLDKGHLSVGSVADVTLVDPEASWEVSEKSFSSKGINSPFIEWQLRGQITDVLVSGRPVLGALSTNEVMV